MKRTTRRLERVYRKTNTDSDYKTRKAQLNNQRSFYQTKYNVYWSSIIAEYRDDSKKLWSKLKLLMSALAARQSSGFNADDFAKTFVRKVAGIRAATASSPLADIRHRNTMDFSTLEPVAVTEVEKLIAAMLAKSCQYDNVAGKAASTWRRLSRPCVTSASSLQLFQPHKNKPSYYPDLRNLHSILTISVPTGQYLILHFFPN